MWGNSKKRKIAKSFIGKGLAIPFKLTLYPDPNYIDFILLYSITIINAL